MDRFDDRLVGGHRISARRYRQRFPNESPGPPPTDDGISTSHDFRERRRPNLRIELAEPEPGMFGRPSSPLQWPWSIRPGRPSGTEPIGDRVGESPCSGCETGLPSRPFAFRPATATTPQFAPLRGHGITTARALRRAAAPRHDSYANGLTASRMRSACCLRGSGTSAPAAPTPTRPRLRLPGTKRPRFALHGAQRGLTRRRSRGPRDAWTRPAPLQGQTHCNPRFREHGGPR